MIYAVREATHFSNHPYFESGVVVKGGASISYNRFQTIPILRVV
jgi:hypothetical protein